jgi:hypothetical protein
MSKRNNHNNNQANLAFDSDGTAELEIIDVDEENIEGESDVELVEWAEPDIFLDEEDDAEPDIVNVEGQSDGEDGDAEPYIVDGEERAREEISRRHAQNVSVRFACNVCKDVMESATAIDYPDLSFKDVSKKVSDHFIAIYEKHGLRTKKCAILDCK